MTAMVNLFIKVTKPVPSMGTPLYIYINHFENITKKIFQYFFFLPNTSEHSQTSKARLITKPKKSQNEGISYPTFWL